MNKGRSVVCGGGSRPGVAPLCQGTTAPTEKRKPIGRLVGAFKTVSTRRINHLRNTPGVKIGQRNYYEHIIRNYDELNRIREYIANSPAEWEMDRENPNFVVGTGLKPAPEWV